MGAWGPALWSDDTAADVRSTYREALEDGVDDEAATAKVLADFADALGNPDDAPVVWLALAAAQSNVGRLADRVRTTALEMIDSGADLRRWEGSDKTTLGKRQVVLAKLREQLLGEQPPRKKIRRPSRPLTTLVPGDVVAFRAESGRLHLLAVRALAESRHFVAPVVQLLDFAEPELPDAERLRRLEPRVAGRLGRPGRPAEPWWNVDDRLFHRRGRDYGDCGFELVAHLDPLADREQTKITAGITGASSWPFWAEYLEDQDRLLGERLARAAR